MNTRFDKKSQELEKSIGSTETRKHLDDFRSDRKRHEAYLDPMISVAGAGKEKEAKHGADRGQEDEEDGERFVHFATMFRTAMLAEGRLIGLRGGSVVHRTEDDRSASVPGWDAADLPSVDEHIGAPATVIEEGLSVTDGKFMREVSDQIVVDVLATKEQFVCVYC